MRRGFSFSYILIPLVYVLVIGGLLFLQFSGASLFKADVGPFSLTAAFEMGGKGDEQQITSLGVRFSGLSLDFGGNRQLEIETQDERRRTLELRGYEKLDKGFRLLFTEDVQLELSSSDASNSQLIIDMSIPDALLPLRAIRLPYAAAEQSQLQDEQNASELDLRYKDTDWVLSLPSRAFVDAQNKVLVIPGDSKRKTLRLAEKTKAVASDQYAFYALDPAVASPKDQGDRVKTFFDTAYIAWKGSRYSSSTGTWAMRSGENAFREEILVCLLAEAWNRPDFLRVYTEMRSAADQHAAKLTWRSSLYLGSLKRLTSDMLVQDQAKTRQLGEMITAKNNDILLEPALVQFATDRATAAFRASLRAYLDQIDPKALNPRQMLGLLQQVYVWPVSDPDFEPVLQRFAPLARDGIAPWLKGVDDGVLFLSDGNKADLYYSILAGRILMDAGLKEKNQGYETLGRVLIMSSLKLADEMGYLPAEITIAGETIASLGDRYRGPEEVYALLQNNPAYPQQVSLFRQAGQNVYFCTVAKINTMDIRPAEYRINLSYPRQRTHFIFFNNLKPVNPMVGMQLFGITWRNASDFETYVKGRYYDQDKRILMIKYTDNSVSEDIRIWFDR